MAKVLVRVAPVVPAAPADEHAGHDHAAMAMADAAAAAKPKPRRPRPRTPAPMHRQNIESLTPEQLANFREAIRRVAALKDDRGYQYWSGIHGLPLPIYCKHGSPLFAIWHRPYLYMFEKALQDVVPGVTLPYWDWTSDDSIANGLPAAYTDENDADGNPNPLFKQPVSFSGSQVPETSRDPGDPADLQDLADLVTRAQRTRTGYVDYSRNLENPHNGIHGWVGGTMGVVPYSAYDPIFWAHHANVDRFFAEWQAAHPEVGPPTDLADVVLQPFNVTVKQVWNMRDLGYDYVAGVATGAAVAAAADAEADTVKLNGPVATFRSADLGPSIATAAAAAAAPAAPPNMTAYIKLHNLDHPRDSFQVRVFLNQPDANADTPTRGNPHYAGSIHLFGHGDCEGDVGHCDPAAQPVQPFDIRPEHHLTPMTMQLDASEAVAQIASQSPEITVSLVAVDKKGKQIADPGVEFESLSIDVV